MEGFVPNKSAGDIFTDTLTGTLEGMWKAVQMPFEDVNLKRKPIPDKLQQIADDPYALPKKMHCECIRQEIAELDTVLGPDVSAPGQPSSRKGQYIDRGTNYARDEVVHMITSKVDIIPFRSVVRDISGADQHAKAVEHAYQAGKLRRAFLKGVAMSISPHCLDSYAKAAPPPPTTLASLRDQVSGTLSLGDSR